MLVRLSRRRALTAIHHTEYVLQSTLHGNPLGVVTVHVGNQAILGAVSYKTVPRSPLPMRICANTQPNQLNAYTYVGTVGTISARARPVTHPSGPSMRQ